MFQVDLFGASLVRSLPNEFDKSGNGNRLAGAYATSTKLLPQGDGRAVRVLATRRQSSQRARALGTLSQTTIGTRVAGQLPARLDYGVEMAMQRGGLEQDSINAWAGHWQVRASLPGWAAPKLTSEYNFATGDDVPNDGTRQTFDQLYPTGHDKLGLADQIGWRNIHHLREGIEITPIKATPISLNYHSWWLASAPTASIRRAALFSSRVVRRRGEHARRAGDRPAGHACDYAADSTRRRIRLHLQRRLSARSDTRRLLQLPIRSWPRTRFLAERYG